MLRLVSCLALISLPAVSKAEVTLINVFEVPDGQMEATLDAWEIARDFLSHEPGYIATALHQAQGGDARFQLINVAKWESAEAFLEATARMRAAQIMPRIPGLGINPALYTVVRGNGALEITSISAR